MTKIVKRKDGYWIIELPCNTPDCGPYDRLHGDDSATDDLHGLELFFIHEYRPIKKIRVKTKSVLTKNRQ